MSSIVAPNVGFASAFMDIYLAFRKTSNEQTPTTALEAEEAPVESIMEQAKKVTIPAFDRS